MDDIVDRLRTRAKIRRQIPGRKSVQEGKADRIADILEEAANEIERLRLVFGVDKSTNLEPCKEEIHHGPGHQSHSVCDKVGPHKQHSVSTHGLYWHSKPGKVSFSGYFDESPEQEEHEP